MVSPPEGYGALRADDLQRILPDNVQLTETGITMRLHRTKTTGAGKRVRDLVVHVPAHAWLASSGWMSVGHDLWKMHAPGKRDFFLPRPGPSLSSFGEKVAEPSDVAALNQALLEVLKVPVPKAVKEADDTVEGGVFEGRDRLVDERLVGLWTGHSEISTLTSGLAAMGVPKTERDPLGRWCPQGSDEYVRSHRALVRRLLTRYTEAAQKPDGFRALDEGDAITCLTTLEKSLWNLHYLLYGADSGKNTCKIHVLLVL